MKKIIHKVAFILLILQVRSQQCTNTSNQRCLCTTNTYCNCSTLTPTNTLNFSLSYYSHLVLVTSQGCRPCPSNCLKCSSMTVCTQCLSSFELSSGTCNPCPPNCQACSNGVCSTCIERYYIDYQANCQSCPIVGTSICTINSLQSCLSNYWLDNNAANCISCDPHCQQCSSTTKCTTCNIGFYLQYNYTCATCQSQCFSCQDSNSCIICANQTLYFNTTLGVCSSGNVANCLFHSSSTKCTQCNVGYYLNSSTTCIQIQNSQLINQCSIYGNSNGTIICRNCTNGYFNLSTGCYYGCSILCTSCYGPHYGLCYGCISTAYLLNSHCIPIYNLAQGASYQLFFTAFNNPNFFSGWTVTSKGCLLETMSSSSNGVISMILKGLQSYEITVEWKVYLYNLPNGTQSFTYEVVFNNTLYSTNTLFKATYCLANCNSTSVCIAKATLHIANIILNQNQLTFISGNNTIGVSEVLIIANRCGGIQGGACLECSSTSTCTKCVNPNYYILGYTCTISCPASFYVRVATKTCLSQCVPGTFSDNIQLICQECQTPCLTCSSSSTCLTCLSSSFLFGQVCLSSCPSGYFANSMRNTCDACISPCLTCISNIQCTSCIYGFYESTTNACVLKCNIGFYGSLDTLTCKNCIAPCLTCNSNEGSICLTCLNGTYFYASRCLQVCPQGFYAFLNQCQICEISCSTCSISALNCTSCPILTYYFNYTCLSSCPETYFADSTSSSCRLCPTNCLICINAQLCQTCINNYFIYSLNNSCLSQCPSLYYPSNSSCYSCQRPCLECRSATSCISCQGLFIYDFKCFSSCPSGTYGDTTTMSCQKCNISLCRECFRSMDYCTSCNSTLILFKNACLQNCPIGYYMESANKICLPCKDNCEKCTNLTYCTICASSYILQDGMCMKVCDIGFYKFSSSGLNTCLKCPTNCASCNNSTICLTCITNYFLVDGSCQISCGNTAFGYNGQCYVCIAPCQTCLSRTLCLSCLPFFGYLLNGNCLNSCPIGYYQNNTTRNCTQCSSNCLNCRNSSQICLTCAKGLVLQGSLCIQSCGHGYYSSVSSNICYKCNQNCLTCLGSPTNCTACSNHSHILNKGNCQKECSSGHYLMNTSCLLCEGNCSSCFNKTYCTACQLSFFLTPNRICSSQCPDLFYPLGGICHQCSYPCKSCIDYQICTSCQSGYFYQGSCVSYCSGSTYLNNLSLTCDGCPSNCSICLGPKDCLECLEGVLVNGSCIHQCPQGYYNYYSVCAPCTYGCLNCNDSTTCRECYLGYLYNGICLEFCPIGWINNQSVCEKCIEGCLKCTVQANQCTLCNSDLFLYLYSCITTCPPGTFKNYKQGACQTCKSPCQTCQNAYSCKSCIYGYILYSEPSGDQCIKGPTCPNSFYLDVLTNVCIYECRNGTYVDPYGYTCNKPCANTYVLLKSNNTCLQYCPSGMWINSNYVCESGPPPILLPAFTCSGLILRNLLIIDCLFNLGISNLKDLKVSDISITNSIIPIEIVIVNSKNIRIVTNTPEATFRQTYFTISFANRYQLYALENAGQTGSLLEGQRRLDQKFKLPVQNTQSKFYLQEYFSYSEDQRQTGMQLMQIGQSICIGSFIFWFFAIAKNLKSTSLTFIMIMQWIYSLSLVNTQFAPNLGLFLEGFKVSNLIFTLGKSRNEMVWIIESEFRERLWGISNHFDFSVAFLPAIIFISIFLFVFLFTLLLSTYLSPTSEPKIEQPLPQEGQQKNGQIGLQSKKEEPKGQQQKSIFSNQKISIFKPNSNNMVKIDFEDSYQSHSKEEPKSQQQNHLTKLEQKIHKGEQDKKNEKNKAQDKQQSVKQESWQFKKHKLGLKCKIIHQRFYYNYWLHCILLTASPLSIAACCQIIAPTTLTLVLAALFSIMTFSFIYLFIRRLKGEQKLLITTKYWMIVYVETMIQNGIAILSTAQIYIGFMILILTINIYVWNKIFSSKRSNQLKYFYQLNDLLRIILLLQALVGYTNKKTWTTDTYYYYSWIFIVTLIVLIVFGAVQNTKQFFDHEEGQKISQTKIQTQTQNRSDSESSIRKSILQHSEGGLQEEQQGKVQQQFFSQHQGDDQDSDNDIIDFDEANSIQGNKIAPQQLIRIQKNE